MARIKNLTQLKAAGGIVSREPVRKEVTWNHVSPDGEEMADTFDVLIVKASLGSELQIHKTEDREYLALVLSNRLMLENDKGKPELITYEDALQLEPTLGMVLFKAVQEVTSPPKNSQQPTNSSASLSPAESAVAP